jgi:D-alanyl-D-alanine carboxypeptidase
VVLVDAFAGWPDDVSAAVLGISSAGNRGVAGTGRFDVDSSSSFRIASLTKVFTSAALIIELGDHGIELATPAIEFFGDLAADWRADRSITVADLLAQVAGLRESVDAPMAAATGEDDDAITTAARLVVSAGSEREPGARWSYYNGNYFLAGAILARLHGSTFEVAIEQRLLTPWQLVGSTFGRPADAVEGWDGHQRLPSYPYPRARRPSGGLWSSVDDLLTFAEHVLADAVLLEAIRQRRTRSEDPMAYGLGWAIGPTGQLYLNGRLPGYRAALLLVPDNDFACVSLASQEESLPLIAASVSRQQLSLTGDDLAAAIDAFAA